VTTPEPETSAATTESMRPDGDLARRIGLVALASGLASAVIMERHFGATGALSSVIGTVVGLLNLWALARVVTRLLDPKVATGKGVAMALLLAKTAALFLGVGLLISRSWVHGGSFMAGITAVVVAIAGGGLWDAVSAQPAEDSVSSDSDEGKR
jgi:peptidoglycan biosynthesis protein MviN/MurJ (putative lipid II flippase)